MTERTDAPSGVLDGGPSSRASCSPTPGLDTGLPPLGPHMAWLTAGRGGRREQIRARARLGARPLRGPDWVPRRPQEQRGSRAGMGTLSSALKAHTSSWCPVLAPGRSARATGLAGRQAPAPRARGHPSWSDPIKIHYKGKKRVGQRVKGRKMMLRQAFVCSSPRTRSREDKRGPGALFSGAGGSQAQWGDSVGRREASGTHRLGPAPPVLAFVPSDTTAASHPDACQRRHRPPHPPPPTPPPRPGSSSSGPADLGQRGGLQLHLGCRKTILGLAKMELWNFPAPEAGSQLLLGALKSPQGNSKKPRTGGPCL